MFMKIPSILCIVAAVSFASCSDAVKVEEGKTGRLSGRQLANFNLTTDVLMSPGSDGSLFIQGPGGYEITLHNGPVDGTTKTGGLRGVRNLYRSLVNDTTWFTLGVNVTGQLVRVSLNGTDVVNYVEPAEPYRLGSGSRIRKGNITCSVKSGNIAFRNITVTELPADLGTPGTAMPAVDETRDSVIRFQQRMFPLIDWHVHLKGGLTKEMATAMSQNYGISYGVAPNAGEGGVGRMLADDREVYEYFDEVKDQPFFRGVQGEGRRWMSTFSAAALNVFDYLFTDAMTIVDHKGRISRIYHPEEVKREGLSMDQYMDLIVDQIVAILTNEPADIYANATYIPGDMQDKYAEYWTPERVDRVLDVLQQYGIAMEISARYKIPGMDIIRKAKERGIKFTFGTNNVDADFGRLEYCIQAVHECGLTVEDLWWPAMGTRKRRCAGMGKTS